MRILFREKRKPNFRGESIRCRRGSGPARRRVLNDMSRKKPKRPLQKGRKRSRELPEGSGTRPGEGSSIRWLLLALLIIATSGVYLRVVNHEFVGLDDATYVYQNEQVLSGVTPEGVLWALTATQASNWHPLTWLSHMLDVQLFGAEPGGHHLVNLLIHVTNTAFLALVLYRMTGAVWPSTAVAALFGLHPLHVESVAWVAERKDVLSTFFWILTLWLYARFVESRGPGRYLLTLLAFALGLMAKPMLVTLPFVLLLLDYWPLERPLSAWRRLLLEKVPFLTLSMLSSALTILAQRGADAIITMESVPFGLRIGNALVSYVRYIAKRVWPQALAVYYPHPGEVSAAAAIGAALLLGGLTFAVLRAGRHHRYLPVGWLWFVGTLVPVIGLIQVGEQAMADRYTYIPLIGLFLLLAWGGRELAMRWRVPQRLLLAFFGVILVALAIQTLAQLGYWKNSEALFEHALAVTRDNSMAHTALAGGLLGQGRTEEAIAHYRSALEIDPEYARAQYNLGVALARLGQHEEALAHYAEAARLKPDRANYHVGQGRALYRLDRIDEAIAHYQAALRIDPDQADALNNLGLAHMRRGELDEAVRAYSEVIRIQPDYAEAHHNLGYASFLQGKFDQAVPRFQRALRLHLDDPDTHYLLAEALRELGQLEGAIAHYSEILRLDPAYAGARERLAELSTANR